MTLPHLEAKFPRLGL